MNFLAIPTLKNVRACLRLPISMMPRFSSKVTLARLRTGIASVGSLLRSAAVITASATPTSFFSTAPLLLAFFRAMFFPCLRFALPGRPGFFLLFSLGSFRRGGVVLALAAHIRRLPFGSLGGDDDRMGQTFRAAAIVSQQFVGPLAAGPFHGDLLQLVFEFFLGQLAALQAATRLHDFLDVELEDIAPAELALSVLPPSQKGSHPPPALLQGELDLLADLVVIGDRFLGLTSKRDPDRGHVDEDHQGAGWKSAPGLGNAVIAPGGVEHGLERR